MTDHHHRYDEMEIFTRRDGWIELAAPSDLAHVEKIDRLFAELCDAQLGDDEREELHFVLHEICRNAWEWGNRKDDRRKIRVCYCLFADEIVIKIEDEGEGFDPASVPDPTRDLRTFLAEREASGKRTGGFGLHMARKIMDQVLFNERGNAVLMSKRLKRRSSP